MNTNTTPIRDTVWREMDKMRNAAIVVEYPTRSNHAWVKVFTESGEELYSEEVLWDELGYRMQVLRTKYRDITERLQYAIRTIEECNL